MSAIKYLEGGIWKTLTLPSAVHVGPSAPDPAVKQLWVDTDELINTPVRTTQILINATGTIPLGTFDGDNITGVRISFAGVVAASAATSVYVQPNGLATINAQQTAHLAESNAGVMNHTSAATNVSSQVGMVVSTAAFTSTEQTFFDGTFFTGKGGGTAADAAWVGQYYQIDDIVNGNRTEGGQFYSKWSDSSTITSLALVPGSGISWTVNGRVTMEVI